MNSEATFLGLVQNVQLRLLDPAAAPSLVLFDLTNIQMQGTAPSETCQIDADLE
jgi:hypothetical protein